MHHAIVCLCADWHGCELRAGLRGLSRGWGCLSDCLRTKHLLWPVIKALGNNRHDIHLDRYTFTAGCVYVCVCLNAYSPAPALSCMHRQKKFQQHHSYKHFLTIIDEAPSLMLQMWRLEKSLECCGASGVPSGICGCVGLGKCSLAQLTLKEEEFRPIVI